MRPTPLAYIAALAGFLLVAGCGQGTRSLGEQIYRDGEGKAGRLAYSQGPDWFRFASEGCAICHGLEGQGLVVQAGEVTGAAPAVTRKALAERGYTDALLRRALTAGVDPHGREFHYYMPRWELSDAELDALVAYLGSL
jgi:cytochrome c oxidase subunit II